MVDDHASTDRDPLDLLVEEFVTRLRAGEFVDVEAFAAEHEAHRAELLDLLPTLQALEQVKRDRESTGGLAQRIALPAMTRLGDFRIVKEVGRGGMGVVFEAFQESLSRKVALKVLPQASLLTGNQLRRFQREAQIAAKLHHSNIVPVFGSGETDGYHWYAMQFIDGRGLDCWSLEQRERPPSDMTDGSGPWRERARFVARAGEQAASALHYAHEQGTLHRDVKPANLLLDAEEHLWVTDFGLAKALESEGLTQSGDLLGTLQYMAPEQFAGHYDARSEVYALGITLYELLTSSPAYAAKTRSELMDAIQRGRAAPLRRACPDVPSDLVTVIEKATAREPTDRYATAELLEHDLQAFLEDRPIAARRQSPIGSMLRWCRRNRAMAIVAAAALVAIVGAAITGWAAYVYTDDALSKVKESEGNARQATLRAENNLQLSLAAFDEIFDALVGNDPVLMFEEDPDTGEQTVVTSRAADDEDVALLQKMLSFYDDFAAQNAASQSLRFETARAYRRVGVIQARLRNLEEAAKAYDQALARYLDVTDRDITRELAAVHVEYGQLEVRRGEPRQAGQRYGLALKLLEQEPSVGDHTALNFDRANVRFQMAQNAIWSPRADRGRSRDRGPGDRGPGGRRPPDGRADRDARGQAARSDLDEAQSILASLLEAEVVNPEILALSARCLMLSARLPGTDADRRAADAEAGLRTLRELVKAKPGSTHLRLLLCETLLDQARRRGRDREQAMAHVIEARKHADALVRQQPNLREYRALRARIGADLGSMFVRQARQQEGALQQKMLKQAETELKKAVAPREIAAATEDDGRFLFRAVMAAGQLDALLRAADRVAEADAELERIFAGVTETAQALVERGGQRRLRLPSASGRSREGRGERGRFADWSPEFRLRIGALLEALPSEPERSGRGPRRPGEPERRGR